MKLKLNFVLDSNKFLLIKIIIHLLKLLILPIIADFIFFLIVLSVAKIQISFIFIFLFIKMSMFLLLFLLAFVGRLNWGTVLTTCYISFPLGLIYILLNSIIKDKDFELLKYPKLSIVIIFAKKLETKQLYSAYLLLITIAAHSIFGLFGNQLKINIYFLLGVLIYASLLYLNTFLVNYRIKKGFYGGNEFEAREIINFLEIKVTAVSDILKCHHLFILI